MAGLLALYALFLVVGSALSFAMVPADPKLQRLLADRAQLHRRIDVLLQQRAGLAAKHDRLWLEAERQVRLAQHRTRIRPAT